jgi:hypothetical protein
LFLNIKTYPLKIKTGITIPKRLLPSAEPQFMLRRLKSILFALNTLQDQDGFQSNIYTPANVF